MQEKEKDALQIKNRFQALVDNVRVFWARVQDALTIPVLDENRRQVLASTSKRLEELTTQMSEYVHLVLCLRPFQAAYMGNLQAAEEGV